MSTDDMAAGRKEKLFWNWFDANNHKFLFINEVDDEEREKFLDEILERLHDYCPELYFEIGGHPDIVKVDFIITAEGYVEYFGFVEKLAAAAPDFDNWNIIAFKPPMGNGFLTVYENEEYDPNKTVFLPLDNDSDPTAVGLKICFSDYEKSSHEKFLTIAYIMLDTLIGEKAASLDVDYLDVIKTPENLEDYTYDYLPEVASFISSKKRIVH